MRGDGIEAPHDVPLLERQERIIPGTLIAGRYRVSQFLGAGGMGIVYRADDLWLGVPVAIKFLALANDDSAALDALRMEVLLARRVSHPFVTRVHDLGSSEGDMFLTMEFVDGENLASLVERVGGLPERKLHEIAWETLAGLQAIHGEGVLHCDLKPENVLIDGRGRARITDFGVATANRERQAHEALGGTPAFMAPELMQGQPATEQSDLFALGATLFYAATGQMPHRHDDGQRQPGTIEPSEQLLQDFVRDEAFRALVWRCLAVNPRERPASALAALELLRGEAPSRAGAPSDFLPAATEVAALAAPRLFQPRGCQWLLLGCLLATAIVLWLSDRTMLLPRAGLSLAPNQLVARSQAVLQSLTNRHAAREFSHGFALDRRALEYQPTSPATNSNAPPLAPASFAVYFWYRDGETFAEGPVPFGEPALARDRALRRNVVSILLTADGRLREYLDADGGGHAPLERPQQPADWSACFRWAGLDLASLRSIQPRHHPPVYADELAEWEGLYAGDAALPIRVEAAATQGRTVFFRVVFPWEKDSIPRSLADFTPTSTSWRLYLKMAMLVLLVVSGLPFAVRRLRAQQADVPGARRLAVLTAVLVLAEWVFAESHVAEIGEEVLAAYLWMAAALLHGALVAVAYLAVEPALRGAEPGLLAGWTRLLQLRLRDGRVGDEVLAGCLVGLGCLVALQLITVAAESLGIHGVLPISPTAGPDTATELGELLGLRFFGGILVQSLLRGVTLIWLALIAFIVFDRVSFPVRVLQVALFITLVMIVRVTYASDGSLPWTTSFVVSFLLVAALLRLGVLAAIVGLSVLLLLTSVPLTLHREYWFAVTGWSAAMVVVALSLAAYVLTKRSHVKATATNVD